MTPLKLKFLFEDPQISELARTLVEKDACVFQFKLEVPDLLPFLSPFHADPDTADAAAIAESRDVRTLV